MIPMTFIYVQRFRHGRKFPWLENKGLFPSGPGTTGKPDPAEKNAAGVAGHA